MKPPTSPWSKITSDGCFQAFKARVFTFGAYDYDTPLFRKEYALQNLTNSILPVFFDSKLRITRSNDVGGWT